MNDIEVSAWLNEHRLRALRIALMEKGADTVEDKLSEALEKMYQEYVPIEHRLIVESKIDEEQRIADTKKEANRKFALFHIRENGRDSYFTCDYFKNLMSASYRYRLYSNKELSSNPESLADSFLETSSVSWKDFNDAVENGSADKRLTAFIEFNLDEEYVTARENGENEWSTYSLTDVSDAIFKAYSSDYYTDEARREIFNSFLCNKELENTLGSDELTMQ